MSTQVVIIGAGPAGLTAAYLLAKAGVKAVVLETDPHYVGGIAKTVHYKNFHFDIGGHRFFSKSEMVEAFWQEILPNDMLERPRSSRIYYQSKFFSYPLKPIEALYKLGLLESLRCVLSYFYAKILPIKPVTSFSDWVTNQFGKRLFYIFFKTYTEKVWGMPCNEISADWAAQRIKGLSLFSAVMTAFLPKKSNKAVIKTLIDHFRYPRKGPGMLWEACRDKIIQMGGEVQMDSAVMALAKHESHWTVSYQSQKGERKNITANHVICSAPLRHLVLKFMPDLFSAAARKAASHLKYRDFLIVVLIVKEKNRFFDNWIYVHDAKVDVARIQNFKSWSPDMVPDPNFACYGLEYFCFKDDAEWSKSDELLIAKASQELCQLNLSVADEIIDGYVVRQPKAYPVYDNDYRTQVDVIRKEINEHFPTLHVVGRNGMHKYNNQDHAMMTAMLSVKNILAGKKIHDVWCVNQDAEYHEVKSIAAVDLIERAVPQKI